MTEIIQVRLNGKVKFLTKSALDTANGIHFRCGEIRKIEVVSVIQVLSSRDLEEILETI